MKPRRDTVLPWVGPLALLAVLLWHTWPDPDIWYHLTVGRNIFEHGSFQPPDNLILQQEAYVNIYWLFQLLVWGGYLLAGVPGVTALFLAVWCLAFTLWGLRAKLSAGFGPPLAVGAVLTCDPRFMERPEVFSYLFLALFLFRLEQIEREEVVRPGELLMWAAVQAVWTNMHGFFFLGPAVAVLWAAARTLERRLWPRSTRSVRGAWGLPGALLAATLISPFGLGPWRLVLVMANYLRSMRMIIDEFHPYVLSAAPGFRGLLFWAWIALVSGVALVVLLGRRRLFEPALVGLGVALAVYTARNAPLAVFLSAPAWGALLSERGAARRAGSQRTRRAVGALNGVLALAVIVFVVKVLLTGSYRPLPAAGRFGARVAPETAPLGPLRYLADWRFRGTLFNHPSDGGYLAYHFPELRLYGDSRFVDAEKTLEYFQALVRPRQFLAVARRHPFDAVLANVREGQAQLIAALAASGEWDLVYADLYRGLLVNRRSSTAGEAPRGSLIWYAGEDLTDEMNVVCVLQWLKVLERWGRPDLVVLALQQLTAAPRLPADIIVAAQRIGDGFQSREILQMAAALASRAF